MAKWDPRKDPVVHMVKTSDNEIIAQTKSGRYVSPQQGVYVNNYVPPKNVPGGSTPAAPKAAPVSPANRVTAASTDAVGLLTHGKGSQTVNTPTGVVTMNVRALQNMLVKKGYDLKVDGQLGPTTLSALRDYYKPAQYKDLSTPLRSLLAAAPAKGSYQGASGLDNPKAWNSRYGTPTTRATPMQPPSKTLNPQGNPTTPPADPTQTAPPQQQTLNLDPLGQQATNVGTLLNPNLANYGSLTPMSAANAIAGEQFDPQIREAQLALSHDPTQRAQDTKDIGAWYQQVLNSQGTARTRDASQEQAGVGSMGDAAAQLVASLGGSANMGSGDVAAAGQNDVGTLQALAQSENQYQNDIAPILQAEKANQLTNQNNKNLNQQQQDQVTLENLQGQRGQALTGAQEQIRQDDNSLLGNRAQLGMQIGQANNQLAQQGFTNNLSLAQARIAALMSGIQLQGDQAKTQATMQKANQAAWARNHPFAAASSDMKSKAFNEATAALRDANGNPLKLTPQQAWTRVGSVLQGYGFNPVKGTPSYNFGQGILNAWSNGG